MSTSTLVILIAFLICLVGQFFAAIDRKCLTLMAMFGFEILAFVYLATILMQTARDHVKLVWSLPGRRRRKIF